tara:strand:- start:5203 stop:5604 length:402 start_codon:yes stop_codon:yes gene_type:complete
VEEEKKTIDDELEIYQHVDARENVRTVSIYLDDSGDKQVDVQFTINEEGKYQLKWLSCGETWSPSYYFSKVGEHVRMTQVSEHCNMVPPDFKEVDIIGITPTEPNEGFRTYGVEDFKSEYEWSREHQDWIKSE